MNEIIPVFRPWYDEREEKAAAEVIRSGWTGLGPKTEEFEKAFARKFYSNDTTLILPGRQVVGLNSATAALDMALKLIGVNRGDQVLVPTITFVSTAHVIKYNLAEPIFVDVDPSTLNIDLQDMERKLTKRTKAVIPVHYAGRPVDIGRLTAILDDFDRESIWTIEDCAHAAGARLFDYNLPMDGLGCFSFHAVKNLSMGEGGALVTSDPDMIARAKRLRWLGIDKGTWERTDNNKSYWWEYSVDEIGLKSHMDDIHAAMGLVQLDKLEESNYLRAERVSWYRELLGDLVSRGLIELPPEETRPGTICSWHLFCIQTLFRDDLSIFLKERGIMTGVHYKPIHLYKCYGNKPLLPKAEQVFPFLLTLPLFPGLTRNQMDRISDAIHDFFKTKGR